MYGEIELCLSQFALGAGTAEHRFARVQQFVGAVPVWVLAISGHHKFGRRRSVTLNLSLTVTLKCAVLL
jgi:hypothetical protein